MFIGLHEKCTDGCPACAILKIKTEAAKHISDQITREIVNYDPKPRKSTLKI